MRSRNTMVARLAVGLFLLAVACGIAAEAWFGSDGGAWPELAAMAVLMVVAENLVLRYRSDEHTRAVNFIEAVLAPMMFGFAGAPAIIAVAVAQAVAAALRKTTVLKGFFNVAQWASAAGAGSLAFLGLRTGATLSPRNVAALACALFTVAVVNQIAFTYVMHLVHERSFRAMYAELWPMYRPGWMFGWPLNTAFGMLFVASLAWSPWAVLLFVPPLLALHYAYRAYGTAAADRARLAGLHRATQALSEPLDPRDAIHPFLSEVRECFHVEAVDLVIDDDGTRVVHRLGDGYSIVEDRAVRHTLAGALMQEGEATRVTHASDDVALVSLLRAEGWRDCIAAPLLKNGVVAGVLCAYNREGVEGFEDGEIDVLQALAQEAQHAIEKGELLGAVLEERRKLSDIVTNTSDGILTLAADGTVLTWNPGLERISGYSAASMTGTRTTGLLRTRDAEDHDVLLDGWATDETALPLDLQITGRDGQTRWLSCSYTRVSDAEGEPQLLIVVARDVTAVREVERLKDDFVATVSHELRTPLTPIKAWATTLLNVGDGIALEKRQEGLRAVLRQAERLEHLITNLLQVSKVERGVHERRDTVIDVNVTVGKVVEEFRTAHAGRPISFTATPSWSKAHGDEMWVEQIVTNLLSNAVKYAPPDQPIEVSVVPSPTEVAISVTDHGPGIPPHEHERIFERFHRLGDHMTRSQGGAGLGLYIARQLALSIGGTLTVDSNPGARTTFTLRVRAADHLVVVA